jgi:hypothetical protein
MITIDQAMFLTIIAMALSYGMGYAKGVLSCKDPSRIDEG